MIIAITHPDLVPGEAKLIEKLFDEGLDLLHIRMPLAELHEIEKVIREIDPKYRGRIALHRGHELAPELGIQRLHFNENARMQKSNAELKELRERGYILSTSVHSSEDHARLSGHFSYCFFGPVFDSISKKDHKGLHHDQLQVDPNHPVKIVALGGIDQHNCTLPFGWGFHGIAVLGALWHNGDVISNFKKIKEACATTVQ